jgi:hypothetical protein
LAKDNSTFMNLVETDKLTDKITEGVTLAIQRLIEKTQKEDGELVISVNGKVTKVRARDIKSEETAVS